MRAVKEVFFCLCLLLNVPLSAKAGTILFSNLTQPGGQYGPDGISIGNNPFFPGSGLSYAATRFVPGSTASLESVAIPLDLFSGPVEFDAYLMSQVAGKPGAVLESFVGKAVGTGNPTSVTLFPSLLHPVSTLGTPYWLAVTTGPGSFGFWQFTTFQGNTGGSSDFATGDFYGRTLGTGGPLGREGAIVVSGIPEPASLAMIVIGLLLLRYQNLRGRRP
jgi:hypothetical protein